MSKLGFNLVMLMDRLVRDLECDNLGKKRPTLKKKLANSESLKWCNQYITDTQLHNIEFYSRLAKTAFKYLKKGTKIFVRRKSKTQ